MIEMPHSGEVCRSPLVGFSTTEGLVAGERSAEASAVPEEDVDGIRYEKT